MNLLLPLCVDLDGTLIKTDVLQEMILIYIYRWPHKIFKLISWLIQGRAYLKQELARCIDIAEYKLPFDQIFLNWLKIQKSRGRQLILVTASDQRPARAIAEHIGIFDDVMASDGTCNLRASCKAQALIDRFGADNFAYAGNSNDDLKVWMHAGEIIAVNTPPSVLASARQINKPLTLFEQSKPLPVIKLCLSHGIRYWVLLSAISLLVMSFINQPILFRITTSLLLTSMITGSFNLGQMVTMRTYASVMNARLTDLQTALQNGDIEISWVFKINISIIALCLIVILFI